jgi:arginase
MSAKKPVQIIGVPLDLGANMRGANMGPPAIRIADLHHKLGVLGYQVSDLGDLDVPIRDTLPDEAVIQKYTPQITRVCDELHLKVRDALAGGKTPLVIGGDHSIAVGTISGVSRYYREKGEAIGLIWVDAHADLNTPKSSPSGNVHGMPLSVVLGQGHKPLVDIGGAAVRVKPENVALVGIRTLDGDEKDICKRSGIRYFTMREIDERGMAAVMRDALEVATKGTAAVHLSFDMDAIDPLYAPGVSTTVTGGLSYREAHLALEMLADTGKLASMEFVELNPMNDHAHATARLLVELAQSALGKSIV